MFWFVCYQRHLVDLLEQCAKYLERAERYEVMGEVFKLAIPIYEQERDFKVSRLKWLSAIRDICVDIVTSQAL